jgi:hypothetical protein
LVDLDWDVLLTYIDVIAERNRAESGETSPQDGAATLRAMAQKFGG